MSNEPTKNFFRVSHAIIGSPEFKHLKPNSQILYIHLCRLRNRWQGHKTYFTRSLRLLMRDSGLSRRAIDKAHAELSATHFVWILKHPGRRTKYHIFEVQDDEKLCTPSEQGTVPA